MRVILKFNPNRLHSLITADVRKTMRYTGIYRSLDLYLLVFHLALHGDEGSLRRNKAGQFGNEHSTHGDVGDSSPDGLTRVCEVAPENRTIV